MGWTTDAALGPPALTPEQLFPHIQRLRAYAVNKKLDMTDAFEEYSPSGYEKSAHTSAHSAQHPEPHHL